MPGSNELCFATSNMHKYRECRYVLAEFGVTLHRLGAKGRELQSDDIAEIATFAAAEAFRVYRRPLIVEDTGLFLDGLGGFPGPYAAYVLRTLGKDGLLSLLSGGQSRNAAFRSAVAYCSSTRQRPRVFEGSLLGEISTASAGKQGFGFDSIFVPHGSRITLAQMTLAEKSAISHRASALRAFGRWRASHLGR